MSPFGHGLSFWTPKMELAFQGLVALASYFDPGESSNDTPQADHTESKLGDLKLMHKAQEN